MDQKKYEFDEMQAQKRDRICRRMFSVLSWTVFLVAGLSVRPSLQVFAPMRWLVESQNLAITIVVIVLIFWLIAGVWLIKAGALVPFRENAAAHISMGLGGAAIGFLFTDAIYFAVALILAALGIRLVTAWRDRKAKAREREKESD